MDIAGHKTLSADGAIKASGGAIVAVVLTAGSDAATVILYDNLSAASGIVLCTLKCAANTSVIFTPCLPYAASKGIYADLSGTGPEVTVVFL